MANYTRPGINYTYIYVYKNHKKTLYTGQTKQDIYSRYRQHIYRNEAGAAQITDIWYFEVPNKFADYIEGYIGVKLNGCNQCCLPNPNKSKYSMPDKYIMRQINTIVGILQNNLPLPKSIKRNLIPLRCLEITKR